ncbi:Cysteine synthase [Gaiella occulta]|uniref:Cysteine synthase n=1 Tax=Gaiella occulta TaxID=1002870 RepID=A0A7M2YWG7_9ACTN|nr:pyridoxal-phosphate dependent enzyme [Gaiella occulta]RDI73919.1 Cysteine synthase [Gaiella occulta]
MRQPGKTPVVPVELTVRGRGRTVYLKLEGANPYGSLKDRTAASLVDGLERRGALEPGSVLVESTSGNLGVALAAIARRRGYRFVAVVDPKTTPENLAQLRRLGARIDCVETPDEAGGYLLARLERVRELCASGAFVWPDQYSNPANPRAHEQGTAPELLDQLHGDLDAVFVPVSTGGTLAGLARCFRRDSPATRIVAVDARGSVALGGRPGTRLLTGIGASRRSSFLTADLYDQSVLVGDAEAFAFCRALAAGTGISVGGSSGAALAACARLLARDPDLVRVACLCPDRGDRYASTIYDDGWLSRNGIDPGSLERGPVEAIGRERAPLAAV